MPPDPNSLRPTREQMKMAMQAADRMYRGNIDPHHLASTLRYFGERNKSLEALLAMVDRYVRFGMPEHELSQMRRLVAKLREEASRNDVLREEEAGDDIDNSMLL